MHLYRAGVNTAGLVASRLYELTDKEEAEPRTRALIDAGFLIKVVDADAEAYGVPLPNPDAAEPEPGGPYVEPLVRLGVPSLPE